MAEFKRLEDESVKLLCPKCEAQFSSMMTVQQGPIVMFGCPSCRTCLGIQVVSGKLTDRQFVEVNGATCVDVPLSLPELAMLTKSMLLNDEIMDELKSEPLAKLNIATERLRGNAC